MLSDALDLHFLEPFVSYDDSLRVKEVLVKPKPVKAEALSFMKPVERKHFEPRANKVSKISPFAKVDLPASLKVLVFE